MLLMKDIDYICIRLCSFIILKISIYLAEAVKTGQKTAESAKATAGKKVDEAKNAGENLRKKASDSIDDL
jgi:hypothetical protein